MKQEALNNQLVRVRGARENNLKNVDVDIPRNALVVFTGVSGSGKSSLAFGTLYAEAQRRYLDSVSPYARRLFNQMAVPQFDTIDGLPPAVALQQQRGGGSARSSVGSVTTLNNLLRMLYSRTGKYPKGQPIIYAEGFSPNTPQGACPRCHGIGRVYTVTEKSLVPDDSLTIRQRAIAAWPTAWQGQNLRDILITLGYNVDVPWRELPAEQRKWILFTQETPTVPVYPGYTQQQVQQAIKLKQEPSYMGTFSSAERYIMHTFANSNSQLMKNKAAQYMLSKPCPVCHGKRLTKEALSVTFHGYDIADLSQLPLSQLADIFKKYASAGADVMANYTDEARATVVQRIAADLTARLNIIITLGLGYLTLQRSTPTLSPGELQRLRLATQVHSNLFGVVYVLDEPSAGLHPADTQALLKVMQQLKDAGNSIFVVEHEVEVIRRADWVVDVGPAAGAHGGQILYSGPLQGLAKVTDSVTRRYINPSVSAGHSPRPVNHWLQLQNINSNNVHNLSVNIPLQVLTSVTGISGSGKSSLISQALVQLVAAHLGQNMADEAAGDTTDNALLSAAVPQATGKITNGMQHIKRLVQVNQKPIGRTPRSNLATYTGLFTRVRKLFADTKMAKSRHYNAGRFSFNVAKGRCERCQGEGFVMVELLFLPSVYSPCPVCHGSRYNAQTLEVMYNGKNIADVLNLTVDAAYEFFKNDDVLERSLNILKQVGLGYLRLGQPATELSGGEAQRIKLATELQRRADGDTLYVLDEPTTGLHPADVERLIAQLNVLVNAGNTVVVVEHDLHVIASSDWVIDMGPGAGAGGGKVVAQGAPQAIITSKDSKIAPYLAEYEAKEV